MSAISASAVSVRIEGHEITITNPDKMLWPEEGITKLDYVRHLAELSPYLLPYTKGRYLTTIRFPDGIGGQAFYQKNCPEPFPGFIHTVQLDKIRYVNLDSAAALIWLGNLACIEFHPSLHGIGNDLPLEWIIDIDPSREEERRLPQAALIVGELLDKLGIASIPKTSGATGMQIVTPIRRGYTFEELRKLGKLIGEFLAAKHPRLFTVERATKKRGELIYIDYLQHWRGKTLSAPYTPRARPGAPVSTPLEWSEVEAGFHPRDFHLGNIKERLRQKGDLLAKTPPQVLDHILERLER
ncbi:MAG TPA: non-homologous end-joining DNA ligase [Bacilli bacterium]